MELSVPLVGIFSSIIRKRLELMWKWLLASSLSVKGKIGRCHSKGLKIIECDGCDRKFNLISKRWFLRLLWTEGIYKKWEENCNFLPFHRIFCFYFLHQTSDEFLHGRFTIASFLVKLVLSLGTHEVVFSILSLIVSITIDVVCQETNCLHIWE